MTLSYLITALVSSAVGAAVGWFAGRGARKAVGENGGDTVPTSTWEWARTGVALLLLALMVWTVYAGLSRNECQAENNRAFAAAIAERTEAANVEREANRIERDSMRNAIRGTPPNASLAERRAAGQRYLAALDEADRLLASADAKRAAAPPVNAGMRDCG